MQPVRIFLLESAHLNHSSLPLDINVMKLYERLLFFVSKNKHRNGSRGIRGLYKLILYIQELLHFKVIFLLIENYLYIKFHDCIIKKSKVVYRTRTKEVKMM